MILLFYLMKVFNTNLLFRRELLLLLKLNNIILIWTNLLLSQYWNYFWRFIHMCSLCLGGAITKYLLLFFIFFIIIIIALFLILFIYFNPINIFLFVYFILQILYKIILISLLVINIFNIVFFLIISFFFFFLFHFIFRKYLLIFI
jgi:hypothetical protein